MVIRERFSYKGIHQVLSGLLGEDLHAKRVSSLCDATLGVLHSGSLAICAIGQGLAAARSLKPKHAVKQIDRLLSNTAINVDDILFRWVPFIIGERSSIMVAMDWTDFDADNQATIMLALMSDHGRSTPLVWLTVDKSTLKDRRNFYEHRVLVRLAELLPAETKVCIVADRGFGDQKLYKMLTEDLCFDYVIRFRGNIAVTAATGETRTAAAWVQAGGTCTGAAWRRGHRRPLSGGNRGLRSGSRHEASLVPRRQQYRCHRQTTDRLVRSQVGN
jgi:hypothetical protein